MLREQRGKEEEGENKIYFSLSLFLFVPLAHKKRPPEKAGGLNQNIYFIYCFTNFEMLLVPLLIVFNK
jgi:hypothetical protein